MKKVRYVVLGIILIALIGGGVYWYGMRAGWFLPPLPYNPPTAEELERMREVEEASNTQAPNAIGGVGVRPVGSLPPAEAATTSATSTATTTEEADAAPEDESQTDERAEAEPANP